MSSGAAVSSCSFAIDFERWAELARRDPAGFFEERKALIDAFIESAPECHRVRLRQVQDLIDGTRLEAGTPLNALRRLMELIGEHLQAMQVQMQQLRQDALRLSEGLAHLRE